MAREAQELYRMLTQGASPATSAPKAWNQALATPSEQGAGAGGGSPAWLDIEAGRPAFQKNVIEVTRNTPELIQMLQEHAKLWKRYESIYFKVNGRAVVGSNATGSTAKDSR